MLNKVINEAYALNPPQTIRNRRLKILYSTQATTHPPMFLLFANNEELLKEHYGLYYLDVSKIRKIISDTDLYYDDISENVYCDYDTYFELI